MPTDERPLHPDGGGEYAFQHPVKGCVWHVADRIQCYVEDFGKGGNEKDRNLRIGQPAATRLALGGWLDYVMPFKPIRGDKEREMEVELRRRLNHQQFVIANFPLDWDGETAESIQLIEAIDMAHSVMGAGGACTICEAGPPDYDHLIGCDYVSAMLHQIEVMSDPEHEPTLQEVVDRANEQIARMT